MQEQVQKNFATFERALGMFTPSSSGDGVATQGADEAKPTSGAKPSGDDIDTLKAEMLAMQQRLERLSRN